MQLLPSRVILASLLAAALTPTAQAKGADHAAIQARLAEIEPLRSQRIAKDPPTIPASAWEQVAAGKIATGVQEVPGYKAKMGWGAALLEVDVATMWRALNEELHHKDLLGLDHVEVVKGSACQYGRQVLMVMPLPIVSDRWWVVQNSENTKLNAASGGRIWELRWDGVADATVPGMSDAAKEKVEGAVRVVDNTGSWFLVDLDGSRTLVEYYTLSDPGGNIPAGTASSFAAKTIDATIESMEGYARTSTPRCSMR